jgi:hypothetical protein
VTALPVVPDLEVIEDRVRELDSGVPALAVQEFDLHRDQNDSIIELS